MEFEERVGRALAVRRHELGKTQAEVSKVVGLSTVAISRLERGHRASPKSWKRIANHYGITARELLERAARIPEPEEGDR